MISDTKEVADLMLVMTAVDVELLMVLLVTLCSQLLATSVQMIRLIKWVGLLLSKFVLLTHYHWHWCNFVFYYSLADCPFLCNMALSLCSSIHRSHWHQSFVWFYCERMSNESIHLSDRHSYGNLQFSFPYVLEQCKMLCPQSPYDVRWAGKARPIIVCLYIGNNVTG